MDFLFLFSESSNLSKNLYVFKLKTYLNQYSIAVGLVLSSSDNRNHTKSVYDIRLVFADLVTHPEKILSMILVERAARRNASNFNENQMSKIVTKMLTVIIVPS